MKMPVNGRRYSYGTHKKVKFFTPSKIRDSEDDVKDWRKNLFKEVSKKGDKVYSTDLPSDYLDYPLSSEGPAARASPGVDIGSAFRLRREPHSVILRKLEGVMLGSPCGCGRPYRPHSVLASLMKHVTNWDRIVMSKMDELVTPVTNNDDNGFDADENDPRFGVRVNFAPILGQKISSQRSVVKEILFQGHKKAQIVLSHPLMETYLSLRIKDISLWLITRYLLYIAFVISFTLHQVTAFFFRPSGMEGTFLSPSCAKNPIECALGWLVMATFLALVVEEVLHVVAYGARYYKRSDAWIRLLIFSLVFLSFFFLDDLKIMKYFSTVSLPVAWFGVIHRSTYYGSMISAMYLHILHKRLLGGFMLALTLAMACGSAFLIISYEEGSTFDFGFFVVSVIRPVMMVLGEFEFMAHRQMYADRDVEFALTAVLLVLVAMLGTIILVNLILALILSDVGNLYKISHRKELFRMARQVVFHDTMKRLMSWSGKKKRSYLTSCYVDVCVHDFCNDCPYVQLKDKQITQRLKALLMKNRPQIFKARPVTAVDNMNNVIDEIM